jgi:hypothetical protein
MIQLAQEISMHGAHATRTRWLLAIVLFSAACAAHRPVPVRAPGGAAVVDSPAALAALWDAEHVSPPLPPLVRHADVEAWVKQLQATTPDLFSYEEIGRSVEGRSINHVRFGHGPFHVLLWSQMHGDEPSATCALFDVFELVRRHRGQPQVGGILDALTVHVVPMLNPDGAERFQRRNAQGLDVNRDALLLQSPEGRALKALRDRLDAPLGFNLHNQSWRTGAGKTGEPASISLLAVRGEPPPSQNAREGAERGDGAPRATEPGGVQGPPPSRNDRAKKVCAVIRDALEALAPGQVARYDDEFEVRAFGDNITKWGTSVVLIETGAWPGEHPDAALVRLNFVALVSSLEALATGAVERADPRRYDSLPMNNDSNVFYRLIRHASIVPGTGVAPFAGDVGLVVSRSPRMADGGKQLRVTTRIDDVGDLRVFGALETIEAEGLTVAPLFDPALKAGDEIQMPDWTAWKGSTISTGQPGDLVLLRPIAGGRFRVERVLRADLTADSTSPR